MGGFLKANVAKLVLWEKINAKILEGITNFKENVMKDIKEEAKAALILNADISSHSQKDVSELLLKMGSFD